MKGYNNKKAVVFIIVFFIVLFLSFPLINVINYKCYSKTIIKKEKKKIILYI